MLVVIIKYMQLWMHCAIKNLFRLWISRPQLLPPFTRMIIKTCVYILIYLMLKLIKVILLITFLQGCLLMTPAQLDAKLTSFVNTSKLMGISLQITKQGNTIYRGNFGYRDYDRKLPVNNDTSFRMASLSKSMTSAGIMLLVEQGKLKLTDKVSAILGFQLTNPDFPSDQITLQMLLTHQSSLLDCSAYDNFLTDTDIASTGSDIPKLSDLLVSGGKYFNTCLYLNKKPGTYFTYTNMNYVIAGTIIEKVTSVRFDIWIRQNLLSKIGGMSFNPADLININNLAALYTGLGGVWYATKDNWNGTYRPRNLTGYTVGSNAAIYGPHAHVRATTDELLRYINMIRNQGVHNGTTVLRSESVLEIVRARYQYHGTTGGSYNDMHAYGLGLCTVGYYPNDNVLKNKYTVGHTGSGYGLISAHYYSGDFAFAFAVNGILNGYTTNSSSIYQVERQYINSLVDQFISEY